MISEDLSCRGDSDRMVHVSCRVLVPVRRRPALGPYSKGDGMGFDSMMGGIFTPRVKQLARQWFPLPTTT